MGRKTNIGYYSQLPQGLDATLESLDAAVESLAARVTALEGGESELITFNASLDQDDPDTPAQWILTISNAAEIFNALGEIYQDETKIFNYNFFADFEEFESGTVWRNTLYPICQGSIEFASHEMFCNSAAESFSNSQISISCVLDQTPLSLNVTYYCSSMGTYVYNSSPVTAADITEDDTIVITMPVE